MRTLSRHEELDWDRKGAQGMEFHTTDGAQLDMLGNHCFEIARDYYKRWRLARWSKGIVRKGNAVFISWTGDDRIDRKITIAIHLLARGPICSIYCIEVKGMYWVVDEYNSILPLKEISDLYLSFDPADIGVHIEEVYEQLKWVTR